MQKLKCPCQLATTNRPYTRPQNPPLFLLTCVFNHRSIITLPMDFHLVLLGRIQRGNETTLKLCKQTAINWEMRRGIFIFADMGRYIQTFKVLVPPSPQTSIFPPFSSVLDSILYSPQPHHQQKRCRQGKIQIKVITTNKVPLPPL